MKSITLKASGMGFLSAALISKVYFDASDINVLGMTFLAGCLYVSGRIVENKK